MKLLVVEDDKTVGQYVKRGLEEQQYLADWVGDGAEALRLMSAAAYDLVILDLRLPGMTGLEVLRTLRDRGLTMPVLVLTAQDSVEFKVDALRAGADDYVTKPFRLAELLARVRALLRRTPEGVGPSDTEDVRIDAEGRRAWFLGEELQLTAKEFDLLRVLVREQGRVVTREQLMKEIWDTTWFGSTKTLDMHISVLRKKLGDDVAQPRHISTVRGLGFRFERPDSPVELG